MTAPTSRPVAVLATEGHCVVCGYPARSIAVFADRREIHHRVTSIRPCKAPNPIPEGQTK